MSVKTPPPLTPIRGPGPDLPGPGPQGQVAAVLAALHALADDELHLVIGQAKAILDERAAMARASEADPIAHAGATDRRGETFENKMVRGKNGKLYGPYRYRRWWEGDVRRTEYLGKANET